MVPLNSRSSYIQELTSNNCTTTALADFLFGRNINIDSKSLSPNANSLAISALYAIQTNNSRIFSEVYSQISCRNAKPESDWIYNDILLFSLTIGVCKFGEDQKWLLDTLNIRNSNSENDKRLITQTFIDALNGNFDSLGNYPPLMLVIKYFIDIPLGENSYINKIYEQVISRDFSSSKAAFINIASIKAFDIVLMSKEVIDWERQAAVRKFTTVFKKRTHQTASGIWWLLFLIAAVFSLYFLWYYITLDQQQEADTLGRLLTALPFLGFSGLVIPIVARKKKLVESFEKPFLRFYGYTLDDDTNVSN